MSSSRTPGEEALFLSRLDRVMNDPRFEDGRPMGGTLRFYVVAFHWASFEQRTGNTTFAAPRRILAWNQPEDANRWSTLIAADAPRYEPYPYRRTRCAVPLTTGPRAGQPCNLVAVKSWPIHEPNGEWHRQGWCRKHLHIGKPIIARDQATDWPPPRPNVGGLLPAHIPATNWPEVYAAARTGWTPPDCGVNADNWDWLPRVQFHLAGKPALRLVRGDGPDDLPTEHDPPPLRLV